MLKHTSGTACQVFETVRYSSYGVPFGITPGDIEGDGDVDGDDNTNWPGSYQVRCDYDLDGDIDITDVNFTISNNGKTLGRGVLSHSSVANRKGYCGYEHDGVIDRAELLRHRDERYPALVKPLHQPREVRQRARQTVHLVNHHDVDARVVRKPSPRFWPAFSDRSELFREFR